MANISKYNFNYISHPIISIPLILIPLKWLANSLKNVNVLSSFPCQFFLRLHLQIYF